MNQTDIEKILFLDIETVPLVYQYKDLEISAGDLWNKKWQYNKDISPEEQYAKAGIYAEFAKTICIGVGYYKNEKFTVNTIASPDEKEVLRKFVAFMRENFSGHDHLLCAHNGKEFDFPFLCRRFLINDIPLPKLLQIQGKKPWEVKHIDTMDLWKFGDIKNFSSLNLLAHVFGIPSPKDDMDGSMVAKTFYEENDLAKIERYCKKDVITLARVYTRFAGVRKLQEEDIIFM
jgi:3'-5' exonuclease